MIHAKTLLPFIAAAALLSPASAVPAHAYLVYFDNGSTMQVQSHRFEGDKVIIKTRSGEMSLPKATLDIEKTDRDLASYKLVLAKADAALSAGDAAGAEKMYKSLLEMDADDVQVRFLHAKSLIALKQFDGAIYELKRVQELDPSFRGTKTRLGDIYYKQAKYNDAIDQYLLALDEDPKDKEAHLGIGNCYAKQDMFEGAITELSKAIELRPDYADAYATLGFVYYKKSDFEQARETLAKAIELNPSLPEGRYYMGLVYGVLGAEERDSKKRQDFFDKSIESFRKAVTLRRDYPEAHADLGVALYSRGSVARAVEEFKTALSQKPMAVAHNNLAGIYLRQSYYNEAVDEAKKAVSLEPNMVEAYFIMGNAYANLKKYKEAARAYDRYLYYNPEGDMSGEVRDRLNKVLKEGGLEPVDGGAEQQ
ncbi:MAG TPA: tetratricopeptide repeat protein [Nitrospirota bacterium]|jgi:tetratricopeptide (TPR) repeat protein